jgi:hypothetical protein
VKHQTREEDVLLKACHADPNVLRAASQDVFQRVVRACSVQDLQLLTYPPSVHWD